MIISLILFVHDDSIPLPGPLRSPPIIPPPSPSHFPLPHLTTSHSANRIFETTVVELSHHKHKPI